MRVFEVIGRLACDLLELGRKTDAKMLSLECFPVPELRKSRVVANACNAPVGGACPAVGVPAQTYVERQLTWTVVR